MTRGWRVVLVAAVGGVGVLGSAVLYRASVVVSASRQVDVETNSVCRLSVDLRARGGPSSEFPKRYEILTGSGDNGGFDFQFHQSIHVTQDEFAKIMASVGDPIHWGTPTRRMLRVGGYSFFIHGHVDGHQFTLILEDQEEMVSIICRLARVIPDKRFDLMRSEYDQILGMMAGEDDAAKR